MALMNAEVYDALKEAGASEEKARAAATSVAVTDSRFARFEEQFVSADRRFDRIDSELTEFGHRLTKVEREVAILRWMVTFNLAMTVAILYRVFAP